MNAQQAIRLNIEMGQFVSLEYLRDLTDEDLLHRPHPQCNHINWQVGHLIASEHSMVEETAPGSMPPLPNGFADRYARETAASNDPQAFCTKAELLAAFEAQRAGTLAALERTSAADLDLPAPEEMRSYAPTVAAVFSLQASHWLMHAGQWAVIRRRLGKPALF